MSKAKTVRAPRGPKTMTTFKGLAFPPDIGIVIHAQPAGRDILVVRINEYKGRKSLDIRRFWDGGAGTWAPGKGTSIPTDGVLDFLEALRANSARVMELSGAVSPRKSKEA